ncbi:MAG: 2,4-dienoyl-CoA reductase [Christensenellales bacterium]|jgi:2,4-dienoyl-CoA reductase-like NADH-dependent reductase (Old Yellow Enzyme family)
MSNKDTLLAQPLKIGPRTAVNRFAINAMECCDADENGNLTEKSLERYSNLFRGNAGFIDFESITMQYESRARDKQISIAPDNYDAMGRFIRQMKDINDKPLLIFQLNHSGEISDDEFSQRICVKPLPGWEGQMVSEAYIDQVIEDFVVAAKALYDMGADGVDLKLSHGYLGTQMLRPYNDRNWKYGGSWQNRSRFAFEMFERVRKEIPDKNFLLGSKVSMWEKFPGGFGCESPTSPVMDLSEPIDLVKGLQERGASYILQSTGNCRITNWEHMPNPMKPDDVYMHFTMSKIIKDNLKPETVVIGSAYSLLSDGRSDLQGVTPQQKTLTYWGNYNIEHGITDMIALGRQSLADPLLPAKYEQDRDDEIHWCTACGLCGKLLRSQNNVGCVVYNPPYTRLLKKLRAAGQKIG